MDAVAYTEKSKDPWGLLKAGVNKRRATLIRRCMGKSGIVLDVGCGFGIYSRFLEKLGDSVVGVDASKRMVLEGKTHDKNLTLVAGDGELLPFRKNAFDAVLCMGTLIYSRDRKAFLCELNRVTKRNGRLCLVERNRNSPMHALVGKIKENEKYFDKREIFFTKEELEKLVTGAGFEVNNIYGDEIALPVFSGLTHRVAELLPSISYFLILECVKS